MSHKTLQKQWNNSQQFIFHIFFKFPVPTFPPVWPGTWSCKNGLFELRRGAGDFAIINCVGACFTILLFLENPEEFCPWNPESTITFLLLFPETLLAEFDVFKPSHGFQLLGLSTRILFSVLGVGVGFCASNSSIVFCGWSGSKPEFWEFGWIIAEEGGIKGAADGLAATGVDIAWGCGGIGGAMFVTGVGSVGQRVWGVNILGWFCSSYKGEKVMLAQIYE